MHAPKPPWVGSRFSHLGVVRPYLTGFPSFRLSQQNPNFAGIPNECRMESQWRHRQSNDSHLPLPSLPPSSALSLPPFSPLSPNPSCILFPSGRRPKLENKLQDCRRWTAFLGSNICDNRGIGAGGPWVEDGWRTQVLIWQGIWGYHLLGRLGGNQGEGSGWSRRL